MNMISGKKVFSTISRQFCSGRIAINPYEKERVQCILCKHKIEVNYKNPQLISQFCSPVTGLLYDRHITGLCWSQQQFLRYHYIKARFHGLMAKKYRLPQFRDDPRIIDAMRPQRPHPY